MAGKKNRSGELGGEANQRFPNQDAGEDQIMAVEWVSRSLSEITGHLGRLEHHLQTSTTSGAFFEEFKKQEMQPDVSLKYLADYVDILNVYLEKLQVQSLSGRTRKNLEERAAVVVLKMAELPNAIDIFVQEVEVELAARDAAAPKSLTDWHVQKNRAAFQEELGVKIPEDQNDGFLEASFEYFAKMKPEHLVTIKNAFLSNRDNDAAEQKNVRTNVAAFAKDAKAEAARLLEVIAPKLEPLCSAQNNGVKIDGDDHRLDELLN